MRVAVIGGTGLVGRQVIEALRSSGHEPVSVSKAEGVDATTGSGLSEALSGAESMIDVTNSRMLEERQAKLFFDSIGRNLQDAGARAGVRRLVVLSIIGVDRIPGGYHAAKLHHEHAARSGSVPTVVLRSAQFHEFAGQVLEARRTADLCRVQEMLVQPVAATIVARLLADLALSFGSRGMVDLSEIAGPRRERLVDLVERLVKWRHDPFKVEGFHAKNVIADALAAGALLPSVNARTAGPTFSEWLGAGERMPPEESARSATEHKRGTP